MSDKPISVNTSQPYSQKLAPFFKITKTKRVVNEPLIAKGRKVKGLTEFMLVAILDVIN